MSGDAFGRFAAALYSACGWGVPFDDILPPEDRAYSKHHGGALGECLDPDRCLDCVAQRRAQAAEAWRKRWAGQVGSSTLREIERAAAALGEPLPDPRSAEALALVGRLQHP